MDFKNSAYLYSARNARLAAHAWAISHGIRDVAVQGQGTLVDRVKMAFDFDAHFIGILQEETPEQLKWNQQLLVQFLQYHMARSVTARSLIPLRLALI